MIITNAGTDISSPCGREHEYAIQVLNRVIGGEVDAHDAYFSFVCGIDKDDDLFEDKSCWPKANPSLPGPPGIPYVEEQIKEYSKQGKKTLAERLIGCRWVNSEDGWLPPDAWKKNDVENQTLEELGVTENTPCYGGFDLSMDKDLAAGSLVFDTSTLDKESYVGMTKVWTQEDTLQERAHRDNAPYFDWADAGFLEIMPGHSIRYATIADWLMDVYQKYNLQGVAYDSYKAKEVFRYLDDADVQRADNFNFPGLFCVAHPQGFVPNRREKTIDKPGECYLWMANSMSEVERMVFDKILTFVHNPLMNFAIARTVVKPDPGGTSRKIGKKSDLHTRNDPLVAFTMAAGLTWEMKRLRPELRDPSKFRMVL